MVAILAFPSQSVVNLRALFLASMLEMIGVENKKFSTKVKAILAEEKKHLQLCIRLAK